MCDRTTNIGRHTAKYEINFSWRLHPHFARAYNYRGLMVSPNQLQVGKRQCGRSLQRPAPSVQRRHLRAFDRVVVNLVLCLEIIRV
jgi:hypothetical protein